MVNYVEIIGRSEIMEMAEVLMNEMKKWILLLMSLS